MRYTEEQVARLLKANLVDDPLDSELMLWTQIWNKKAEAAFNTESVIRDNTLHIAIPLSCTTFLPLNDEEKAFVRTDFMTAADDILYYYKNLQDRSEENPELQDTSIGQLQHILDRFRDQASEGSRTNGHKSIIVIGHPGIGKTIWLSFLLCLRLLAGLPTLYRARPSNTVVFTAFGVYKLENPNYDLKALPRHAWLLVDGNADTKDTVPYHYKNYGHLIIHTTSPQKESFSWASKVRPSRKYYMRPFSLTELIIGRQFRGAPITELQLGEYYKKFIPTARIAYAEASRIPFYQRRIAQAMSALTYPQFNQMLQLMSSVNGIPSSGQSEISHQIFMVQPTSRSRVEFEIVIPTYYLHSYIQTAYQLTAKAMYNLFLEIPILRASAAYTFGALVHHAFLAGGEWPIQAMLEDLPDPLNTHFKSPPLTASVNYLRLAGNQGQSCTVAQKPAKSSTTPLARWDYDDRRMPQLVDWTYYMPRDEQPTFDSFLYDSVTSTITLFQMAVGHPHIVDPRGFDWLITAFPGLQRFRYVLVTPERPAIMPVIDPTSVDIPFPNGLLAKLRTHAYDLQVWQLGIHIL